MSAELLALLVDLRGMVAIHGPECDALTGSETDCDDWEGVCTTARGSLDAAIDGLRAQQAETLALLLETRHWLVAPEVYGTAARLDKAIKDLQARAPRAEAKSLGPAPPAEGAEGGAVADWKKPVPVPGRRVRLINWVRNGEKQPETVGLVVSRLDRERAVVRLGDGHELSIHSTSRGSHWVEVDETPPAQPADAFADDHSTDAEVEADLQALSGRPAAELLEGRLAAIPAQVAWLREMALKCAAPFYAAAIRRPEGMEAGIPVTCARCGHIGSAWIDPGPLYVKQLNDLAARIPELVDDITEDRDRLAAEVAEARSDCNKLRELSRALAADTVRAEEERDAARAQLATVLAERDGAVSIATQAGRKAVDQEREVKQLLALVEETIDTITDPDGACAMHRDCDEDCPVVMLCSGLDKFYAGRVARMSLDASIASPAGGTKEVGDRG